MKTISHLLVGLAVCLFIGLPTVKAQVASKPFVTVEGEVKKSLKLTMDDLLKMKQAELKVKDRDGKDRLFKGVPLVTILDSAGVTLGKDLRGENLKKYLLMKASDGYEVVFSLAEADPELGGQTILLAYQADGAPLGKEGPFRLVVPNDKRPARWIRELISIKVVVAKN